MNNNTVSNENVITIDDDDNDDECLEPFDDDGILEGAEETFDDEIFRQNCDLVNLSDKENPSMLNIIVNGSVVNAKNGRNGFLLNELFFLIFNFRYAWEI